VRMADREAETERVRRVYDSYARSNRSPGDDGWILRGTSEWLRANAEGETLEVGIGRGRTLPAYGPNVRLTGIELSDGMLSIARRYANDLGRDVRLLQGDAQSLPFPDEHFDTVVFSLVLCTVPDDRLAVAEAVRVLRPGGRLLVVEHVRSANLLMLAIESLLAPIELRRAGDHLLRDPLRHVEAERLEIESLERLRWGIIERLVARKPKADELALAV
jgi:ubiquinone/menaquinone biosynthesis C-methylase UbiE